METMKSFTGSYSKRGLPTLTEAGGGMTNTGNCRMIASPGYRKMIPIHVFTGGQLSNSDHAVFAIREGMKILLGDRANQDFSFQIYEVVSIDACGEYCAINTKLVNYYKDGEWATILPSKAVQFVGAAMDKMNDYHCRVPYYVEKDRKGE